MTRAEFVAGFHKLIVRVNGKPTVVGYIRGNVFRSVIADYARHTLNRREGRRPAVAKEKWIVENHLRPRCDWWEVLDLQRGLILRTTVTHFLEHCEEWQANGFAPQLLMEEQWWEIEEAPE